MELYYKNSIGEVLNLVEWPYMAQTGDILDYEWEYSTNTYKKIAGFSRGVKEKSITLTIRADTKEEFNDVVNEFHRIVERDVLLGAPGRLYVNNCYMQCYVIGSTKAEWEGMTNSYDTTIKVLTDKPQWITEETLSFPSSAYLDFETFILKGSTSNDMISIGELKPITLSAVREELGVSSFQIDTGPLMNYDSYVDILCKTGGEWAIIKRIEFDLLDLSLLEPIIDADYITYQTVLNYKGNGMYKCNLLPAGTQRIPAESLESLDYREGVECISEVTERSNAIVEICGTENGIREFTLISAKDHDLIQNSYSYLQQYTHDYLSSFSCGELETGIEKCSIHFNLDAALAIGERIFRDVDGIWRVERNEETEELGDDLQVALNNFKTYEGKTVVYSETADEQPYLRVKFMPDEYYANALPDGSCLAYAATEFVHLEDDMLYIRIRKNRQRNDLKVMYVLEEEYLKRLQEDTVSALVEIENLDDIKRVIISDTVEKDGSDFGQYPHGFPYGYAERLTANEFISDAIATGSFRLNIYGRCVNPEIYLGTHLYKVNETLLKDEYIVIDSINKTVTKYLENGEAENIYEKRHKEESIFKPIPAGRNIISWDKTYGFDLTLITERSEPLWN